MGEITEAIVRLRAAVEPLLTGGVTWKEVWQVLTTLIREAETVYGAGRGAEKHELVRSVWLELDERYGLVDKIDDMIKCPFWLEPFDKTIIRLGIDMLISGVVTALNMTGWGK